LIGKNSIYLKRLNQLKIDLSKPLPKNKDKIFLTFIRGHARVAARFKSLKKKIRVIKNRPLRYVLPVPNFKKYITDYSKGCKKLFRRDRNVHWFFSAFRNYAPYGKTLNAIKHAKVIRKILIGGPGHSALKVSCNKVKKRKLKCPKDKKTWVQAVSPRFECKTQEDFILPTYRS